MPDMNAKFNRSLVLPVRITKDKKRYDVGTVDVPYPILSEVFDTLPAPDKFAFEADPDKVEEGDVNNELPQYNNAILQWVQEAILEAVKREARNVTKVDGSSPDTWRIQMVRDIPSNWAGILEERKRAGGAHLAARGAAIRSFNEWLLSLGKSQKAIDAAKAFFQRPQTLATVPVTMRAKFRDDYLSAWADTLADENLAEWESHIGSVMMACQDEEVADDF